MTATRTNSFVARERDGGGERGADEGGREMRRGGAIKNTEPEEDQDGGSARAVEPACNIIYPWSAQSQRLFPDRAPIEIETVGGVN